MIDTVGKPFGNAYMIGPANMLTPKCRWRTSWRCARRAANSDGDSADEGPYDLRAIQPDPRPQRGR